MNSYKELFLQAYELFTNGQLNQAIQKLNEAENYSEPDNSPEGFSKEDLLILRGTIYFAGNNLELAKTDFESALKENNSSAEACLGLGQYFFAKGLFENAKVMYEWAVKNNESHPGARKALENVNVQLGYSSGHNSLTGEIKVPEQPKNLGPLDEATEYFSEKKYSESLSKLLSARKEQEEILGSIENFIAFNYLQMNKDNDAKQAAERALRLNPFSSQAYATLGEINFRDKDYAAAKKMFEIALQHNADNNFARTGLENVNNALGMPGSNGRNKNLNAVQF